MSYDPTPGTPVDPWGMPARPAPPTPTALPTGLPEGYDDAESPWHVPEELRPLYTAPTLEDYYGARDTVIFPPVSQAPRQRTIVGGPRNGWPVPRTDLEESDVARLEVYTTDAFKAHHAALRRAQAAHAAAVQAAADRAEWTQAHTCAVCGIVAGDVGGRRVVDIRSTRDGVSNLELVAQACEACCLTLAADIANRYAVDRLPDKRTRLAACRDYLDRTTR